MVVHFIDRLFRRQDEKESRIVVGIDPRVDWTPEDVTGSTQDQRLLG
jgi:hypothetical protein